MQQHADIAHALLHRDPEPVVLVTTRAPNGRPNVTTVEWITFASDDPVMFILGMNDETYTCDLIKQTEEFVIAFPHEGMSREALYAGTHHGHRIEKLAQAGLTAQDGEKVSAPLIADAIANFECTLIEITKPGNCALVVGKVVAAHVNTSTGLQRLFNTAKGYKLTGLRAATQD